jgi:hypothetical protein
LAKPGVSLCLAQQTVNWNLKGAKFVKEITMATPPRKPYEVDISWFDESKTDDCKIDERRNREGISYGVPCRICEMIFCRIRVTWRYCNKCKMAFCEGEHGSFDTSNNLWLCVQCKKHVYT